LCQIERNSDCVLEISECVKERKKKIERETQRKRLLVCLGERGIKRETEKERGLRRVSENKCLWEGERENRTVSVLGRKRERVRVRVCV
jgi:hypothetical protein